MIDIAPRLCDVGLKGPKGCPKPGRGHAAKRKLYSPEAGLPHGPHGLQVPAYKRRRQAAPAGARLVDLQILGEDGALVQEATIEEIWAPHAARLEIVVVDEAWSAAAASAPVPDATFIDLDDLGPLGGTSSLHGAILREAQQHQLQYHPLRPPAAPAAPAHQGRPAPQCAEALDSDFGNLDWLINFKVDSVFEPKKGKARPASPKDEAAQGPVLVEHGLQCAAAPDAAATPPRDACSPLVAGAAGCAAVPASAARSVSPKAPAAAAAAAPAAAPAAAAVVNPHPQAHRYSGPGKPPFTYTELIELALKDKGKLTVKEIYQWITKHFPFYQASDERWKNSVRHNLSINPHFRKESKAPQGAGHLWVVMDNNNKVKNSWKEERIQNFLASQISAAEAAEASANLAAAEAAAQQAAQAAALAEAEARHAARTPMSPQRPPTPPSPVTTGAKSQSQLNTWWSERVSLERSAEEILSGVKREVGVEFLTPMDLDGDLDAEVMKLDSKEEKGFLYGDLTAEQVIAESGLQDELAGLYLLNDMTSAITTDSLFPDDLNFGGLELPLSG